MYLCDYPFALGAVAPRGLTPLRPQVRMHLGRGGVSVLLGLVRTRFGSRPWVDDLSLRVGALAGLPSRTLLVLALRSVHGSGALFVVRLLRRRQLRAVVADRILFIIRPRLRSQ